MTSSSCQPPASNLLLTGGAGFIGCNLARYLLRETNYTILAYDKLTYAGNRSSIADLEPNPRFHFIQADICDRQKLNEVFTRYHPQGVLHLAAESHVDRSIHTSDDFIQTNVVGTHVLLETARDYMQPSADLARAGNFRFLHVSTDEVFGSLTPQAPPFNEQSKYDPHSPYAASKAASDHLVRAWRHTYGLPALTINCSNNYGPFQFPEKLVPVVILSAIHGKAIPIYGKGENIRDWLYVEDHCAAIRKTFESGRPGATYTIGGNSEVKNIDLVTQVCKLLDELHPIAENDRLPTGQRATLASYADLIKFTEDRPGHDFRYAMDTGKIESELGWRPRTELAAGLRSTVQWYLNNETWWKGTEVGWEAAL